MHTKASEIFRSFLFLKYSEVFYYRTVKEKKNNQIETQKIFTTLLQKKSYFFCNFEFCILHSAFRKMDIKAYIASQLNEEQTNAALHTDTSSLIIAGAWSWKTRVLTYKIAYLMRGKKIPITRILSVTFTNKAANEMRERLIKISWEIANIGTVKKEKENTGDSIDDFLQSIEQSAPATKKDLLQPQDTKWIWTFHSIFLKILKEDIEKLERKYTKNFWILDTNETQSVIKDILKRMNLQDTYKVNEIKGFISTQKNNWIEAKMFISTSKSDYDQHMGQIYEEYQKTLEKANALDFDDLLMLPYLLFKKSKETLTKRQNKFDFILVDEAQDTNWIQFELMKMLTGGGANITMIGDDFQSIYGRRWALMENFLNVKRYRPDIQMFKLQINYRSRPHIVQAGNAIIKNNVNQYEKEIVPNRTGDDKITIFSHGSEMDEAANIVDMIKKMKEWSKIKSRWNVAILYRTNAQSSPFEQLFLQEGIPYKVYGAFKFFERKEVKDIISYIKNLLNPVDSISLKRIINIPNRKIWKTTLEGLEEQAIIQNITLMDVLAQAVQDAPAVKVTPQAKKWIKEFLDTMISLQEYMKDHSASETVDILVKKIKYRDYLIKEEWSENAADEKFENVGQIINMAEKYVEKGEDALRQFLEEIALLSDISENEQWDIDAVKLMTVHSSKWLEFPVVFICGLEDYVFPLGNAMMEPKLLEEERRLMYVAVTRAKDILFLSHAQSRMTRWQTKSNPPSRFIDEIPAELIKKFDLWWDMNPSRWPNIDEWDTVKHKLFGTGYVLEIRNNLAIVKFHNPKFWVRKIETRFLQVI